MQTINLTQAGQTSEYILAPGGSRVTLSGSGYIKFSPGTIQEAKSGLLTFRDWPIGSTAGFCDLAKPVVMYVVASGYCTVTVADGVGLANDDEVYWVGADPVGESDNPLAPVLAGVDPLTGGNKFLGPNGKGDGLIAAGVPQTKYQRAPTPFDNASTGYSASSLWQYNGKVYKPAAAPSETSCAWVPQQRKGAYPVDIFGAAAKFAGGTVAMKAGFTGAAIDISVTVASSPVNGTINILASGELDTRTLEGYLSRMDAGTYCTVTKVYDQTGNGNHLVKNAGYAALLLDFDVLMGRYVITGEYATPYVDRRLEIPNTLTAARNSFHMVFMGRSYNAAGNNNTNAFAVLGKWGSGNQISPLQMANPGGIFVPQNPAGGPIEPATRIMVSANFDVFGVSAGASTTDFFCGAQASSGTTNQTNALTGGWIGTDGANNMLFTGRVIGISIGSSVTAAQRSALVEGFCAQYDRLPQARDQVTLIGDSRFSGAFGDLANTFSILLQQALLSKADVVNLSNGSWQISDMLGQTVPQAVANYRTGAKNVAVILAGVNDFLVGAKTVPTVISEITEMVTALKAAGYKVVVLAELATGVNTNNTNVLLPQLASALLSNPMGADQVINTQVYPEVLDATNYTYYPDWLHPGTPLWQLLAGITAPVVDQLLN